MNSNSKQLFSGTVIRYENSLLLCKRQPNGPLGGYWSVPCGAVEEGETPVEAAQRELMEETEIILDPNLLNKVTTFPGHDGGTFYLYVYDAPDFLAPVIDYEHTEWGYFRFSVLEDLHINTHLQNALIFLRDDVLEL
jgi:8-oxo-dGTP diphosphatase